MIIIHFGLLCVASGFVHPSIDKFYVISNQRPLFEKPPQQNSDTVDENVKSKDDDIPSWLKPLLRREKADTEKPSGYTDEKLFDSFPFSIGGKERRTNIWESEMSPLVAQLSGMINVEALMAAANLTTDIIEFDGDVGSMFPSLDLNDVNETDNNNGLEKASIDSDEDIESVLNELAAQNDTDVFRDALSFLDGSLRWEKFMQQIQKKEDPNSVEVETSEKNKMNAELEKPLDMGMILQEQETDQMQKSTQDVFKNENLATNNTVDADKILREATRRLELAMNSASSTFSPSAIQDLVVRATKTLALGEASGNLTLAAKIVFDGASKAPRATAKYTAELIEFANTTLVGGIKPLFNNYASVKSVPSREWRQTIKKGAEYSTLSGAIYENTIAITHGIDHTIVAQGKTADIGWMITDSIQQSRDFDWNCEDQPVMVRSFIIRGYDASDDEVDREGLLNTICTAAPVSLGNSTIRIHEGLLEIAVSLYQELESYIDLTAPSHKIVFSGHSIGGSLSVLLMALLSQRKTPSFVRERVLRAFTFGSPPTFTMEGSTDYASSESCTILKALKLPPDIVYGYAQPWDPIPRLFTKWDPLYPLIDDLGEDGATLYASGPSRTLRPITKRILESWEGWPRFRDNARNKLGQNYRSVGKQFLLIPDPTRYLTDRLVSVNTAVPSVNSVLEVSSQELLPALNEVFSLDTFSISIIPVAIRSFVHHFYPAYGFPLVEFAAKSDPERVDTSVEDETNVSSKR